MRRVRAIGRRFVRARVRREMREEARHELEDFPRRLDPVQTVDTRARQRARVVLCPVASRLAHPPPGVDEGSFRHGQHLHFDPQNPPPLCNLYVNMLQRLGIEANRFSNSTGTLTGLESAG